MSRAPAATRSQEARRLNSELDRAVPTAHVLAGQNVIDSNTLFSASETLDDTLTRDDLIPLGAK